MVKLLQSARGLVLMSLWETGVCQPMSAGVVCRCWYRTRIGRGIVSGPKPTTSPNRPIPNQYCDLEAVLSRQSSLRHPMSASGVGLSGAATADPLHIAVRSADR